MRDALVKRFTEEGVVRTSVLQKGLFTRASVEYIDHNPSSTTANCISCQCSSISLLQQRTAYELGQSHEILHLDMPNTKKFPRLPEACTNVRPAYLKDNPLGPAPFDSILPLKPDIIEIM